jgi:hypothetical protein
MTRARDFERHCDRVRYEQPIPMPPRHALRGWCVVAWWIVAAFLLLATFCEFGQGW